MKQDSPQPQGGAVPPVGGAPSLADLAQGIAARLSDRSAGWAVLPQEPDDICVGIGHEDGRRISLRFDWQDSRKLAVSPRWPIARYQDGRIESFRPWNASACPSIRVSVSRGMFTIAREIERRFLPKYTAVYSEMSAEKTKAEERDRTMTEQDRLICSALDVAHEAGGRRCHFVHGIDVGLEAEIEEPNSVTIRLRGLPMEAALAVIAVMKPYLRKA